MTAPARDRADDARGYTLIELLVVMLIIAIVASIAVPNLMHARQRAKAAAIVSDFGTVRTIAIEYFSKNSRWPADAGPGVVPADLVPLLEGRVYWSQGPVDYEWENWAAPDGRPTHPGTGVLIGFSVRSTDVRLLDTIEQVWGLPLARRADGVTFAIVPITP
jgi:prepilin-type N-terminal cleavage/methylation domain-containing protein